MYFIFTDFVSSSISTSLWSLFVLCPGSQSLLMVRLYFTPSWLTRCLNPKLYRHCLCLEIYLEAVHHVIYKFSKVLNTKKVLPSEASKLKSRTKSQEHTTPFTWVTAVRISRYPPIELLDKSRLSRFRLSHWIHQPKQGRPSLTWDVMVNGW